MSYRGRSVFFVIINRFINSLKPRNIRIKPKHMGSDYLGNKYFEVQNFRDLPGANKTPRRSFVPPNEDSWDGPLPPEWEAWLRMTRRDPPTDEEIQYNLIVEQKKKEFDKKTKSDEILSNNQKFHPISGFPVYSEDEKTQK